MSYRNFMIMMKFFLVRICTMSVSFYIDKTVIYHYWQIAYSHFKVLIFEKKKYFERINMYIWKWIETLLYFIYISSIRKIKQLFFHPALIYFLFIQLCHPIKQMIMKIDLSKQRHGWHFSEFHSFSLVGVELENVVKWYGFENKLNILFVKHFPI